MNLIKKAIILTLLVSLFVPTPSIKSHTCVNKEFFLCEGGKDNDYDAIGDNNNYNNHSLTIGTPI